LHTGIFEQPWTRISDRLLEKTFSISKRTSIGPGGRSGARMERLQTSETNRWCENHGYFIAIEACQARAMKKPRCRRCLLLWRQMPLPFLENIGEADRKKGTQRLSKPE
jgi:hypothetical protein